MQVSFRHDPLTGTAVQLFESSNMLNAGQSAGTGPHETLLVLTAASPTRAKIDLAWSPLVRKPGLANALARVDVGDDGTFELAAGLNEASVSVPVSIPPQGLRIRTVTHTRVVQPPLPAGRVSAYGSLSVAAQPVSRCSVRGGGAACLLAASPQMSGQASFRNSLVLRTQGFQSSVPAWMLVGITPAGVPLSGGVCTLGLVPLAAVPAPLGANGRSMLEVPVGPGVRGSARFQHLIVDPQGLPPVLATGVVELDCP